MTQEDKELLLKDLCTRLPYGVICKDQYGDYINVNIYNAHIEHLVDQILSGVVQMVLRPMSNMTEEEKEELLNRLPKYWGLEIDKLGDLYFDICNASYPDIELLTDIIDWLNAHHFDYLGLIEKGLVLEALEGMYNIK